MTTDVTVLTKNAADYAQGTLNDAKTALNGATQMIQSIGYVVPNVAPLSLPSAPPSSIVATVPVLPGIDLVLPSDPGAAPTFQDISPIDPGVAPTLSATAPTLTLPTLPSALASTTLTPPPINTTFTFPTAPAELSSPFPTAPVTTDRAAPTAPQLTLPAFSSVAPTLTATAPTGLDAAFQANYASLAPSTVAMFDGYLNNMLNSFNPQFQTQMSALEAQLSKYLAGGTALSPSVENAIYNRTFGKVDAETRRLKATIYDDAATRGFTIPDGAVFSAITNAQQAGLDNNARAATEIAINQAEMEQKNLQFAVTTSTALRTAVMQVIVSYHSNLVGLNGQAIECAKAILNAIVETYNIAVRAYSAKLDGYRADVAVFEALMRGAMASVELYRAEIAALEALVTVDRNKVEIYRARIDALSALTSVYRANIEVVQDQANLEKLKLELFQSQVQSYSVQVQAKNSEWQGYAAAMEGQLALTKVYASQVDAYNAQLNGYRAQIEAKSEVVRATALTNQGRAQNYSAVVGAYTAVVQAKGEKARVQIEGQRQTLLAYQVQLQGVIANAQVAQEYYKSVSTIAIQNAQLQLSAQVQVADSTRAYGQSVATLGTQSAHVYSGLAQAAMSGMNTLVSQSLTQ